LLLPSTRPVGRPREVLAIAKRYHRRERPLSALIVVLAAAGFLGTFVATSLAPAVVGGLPMVVARAPIVTGGLSGLLEMLWLSSIGSLQGYGISAILALYTAIGGSIALIGMFAERAVERLERQSAVCCDGSVPY
jgi:hypothetical protein